MPRLLTFPVPKCRYHGKRWRIYWKWKGRQYSLSTPYTDQKRHMGLDADRRLISAALTMDCPQFTAGYKDQPAAIAYILDNSLEQEAEPTIVALDDEQLLADFKQEIQGKNTPGWVEDSLSMLERLREECGDLGGVTDEAAFRYMADMAARRTNGTHNRNLTVFKRFYGWAVSTRRVGTNPFASVKRLKEAKIANIVYCTATEREEIIDMTIGTGWMEWLSVPIAFYAGMRRGEIAALKWEHIRLHEGTILVVESKTDTSRTIPLNRTLEEYLRLTPESKRKGYVVMSPFGHNRLWRLNRLGQKIQIAKRARILAQHGILRPPPSKSKEHKERRKAYEEEKLQRAEVIAGAFERIGWNVFRHTFASILVQSGVDIDTVSSWMGNTPEVCRRHYAQFVPRDRRDTRIDNL